MLNQLIQQNKLLLTFLFLSTITFSKDFTTSLKINVDNSESRAWWFDKKNYGITKSVFLSEFHFKTIYPIINLHIETRATDDFLSFSNSYVEVLINSNNRFKAGSYFREFSSYLNDSLSSGSMLISNNAEALRKAGFSGKIQLNKLRRVSFEYGISHGIFNKTDIYIEAPYLHEKFLYTNINLAKSKIIIGLVHEAMWAGHVKGFGKQPSTFEDYFRIFRASHGSDNALLTDQINALGNHLGIWDFAIISKINHDFKIKWYHQHIFEDDSGFRFKNGFDGLWGLEISKKNLNILLEYIDTTNQSIKFNKAQHPDKYYFHEVYQHGWSLNGYALGNPFIEFKENIPIKVLHLGVNKENKNFDYRFLLSKHINNSNNFIYGLFINKKIKDFNLGISIANNFKNQSSSQISFGYNF